MSTNLAYATPQRAARPEQEQHPRQIEIVSTRAQRRARPRVVYAVATVGGLFALFIAQLLLSIVISDGAYEISDLRVEQRNLVRTEQDLGEKLDLLASQQNLATQAEGLGMVTNTSTPMFLRLSDGAIFGAANGTGTSGTLLGPDGSLVANSLLGDIPIAGSTEGGESTDGSPALSASGASGTTTTTVTPPKTATPGALPSPVTR
ncbi:hypothetical protein EYE40_03550 [Glaciihabitans arcticus]|uniref:Cell division protein FtsL n=1 Tax=Glaciihabitans arcticus TaxID=2668039 RepID=A0A4Q9GP76_9MICO|nr:hypothetical protein [Glaciihabitans arcticus]TBN56546.1 hypothetical protein EYE40_03550 [Glaciihabitans arcticus]